MSEPLGLDWFTNSGTGTGVYQDGAFFVDGVKYFGNTVADDGFFQRYVVRIGGVGAAPSAGQGGAEGEEASHSGGVPGGDADTPHCDAIAPGSSSVCISDVSFQGTKGLGFDPLGLFTEAAGGRITVEDSGNGTNDPTTAVVWMTLSDDEMEQEFLKDSLNYKQKITETLTTPEMVGTISIDMRAIDFNTMNASAPFVNTLTFTEPNEMYSANFNQATDAQESSVTAGQYVYLPQGGWVSGFAGSTAIDFRAGLYLHADGGGFNLFDNDVYGFYYHPAENGAIVPPACATTSTCVLPAFAQD